MHIRQLVISSIVAIAMFSLYSSDVPLEQSRVEQLLPFIVPQPQSLVGYGAWAQQPLGQDFANHPAWKSICSGLEENNHDAQMECVSLVQATVKWSEHIENEQRKTSKQKLMNALWATLGIMLPNWCELNRVTFINVAFAENVISNAIDNKKMLEEYQRTLTLHRYHIATIESHIEENLLQERTLHAYSPIDSI